MKNKTKADVFDYIVGLLKDGLDVTPKSLRADGLSRPLVQSIFGPALKAHHYPRLFDEIRSRVNKFGHKMGERFLRCTNQHEVEMALKGEFIMAGSDSEIKAKPTRPVTARDMLDMSDMASPKVKVLLKALAIGDRHAAYEAIQKLS